MKRDFQINEEQFIALLEDAVTKVKTEEDPVVLTEYKKIFKKVVPLTLRSYVAAYLAKNACGGASGFRHRPRRDKFSSRDRRHHEDFSRNAIEGENAVRQKAPRIVIDEADATTIFIGIGRNRHVFPRDLVGLIAQVVQIERERIGSIKVLDNYSFVQLYKDDADKVINVLNGYDYRGRKLVVSFSRKRDEVEGEKFDDDGYSSESIENEAYNTDYSTEEESTSKEFLV
jgi:hypothetical protein